jgi:hypothetical protein
MSLKKFVSNDSDIEPPQAIQNKIHTDNEGFDSAGVFNY